MGFVFITILGFLTGLLVLAFWNSINLICACAPLTENVANGVVLLSCCIGVVLGAVATVLWG